MGWQIVQQPNGQFAIWSSVVDNFVCYDCEPDELVSEFSERFRGDVQSDVDRIVTALRRGERPHGNRTKSLDDCLAIIREAHGETAEREAADCFRDPDSETTEHD